MMIRPHIASVVGRELEGRQAGREAGRGHKPKSGYRASNNGRYSPSQSVNYALGGQWTGQWTVDTTGRNSNLQTFNDNLYRRLETQREIM